MVQDRRHGTRPTTWYKTDEMAQDRQNGARPTTWHMTDDMAQRGRHTTRPTTWHNAGDIAQKTDDISQDRQHDRRPTTWHSIDTINKGTKDRRHGTRSIPCSKRPTTSAMSTKRHKKPTATKITAASAKPTPNGTREARRSTERQHNTDGRAQYRRQAQYQRNATISTSKRKTDDTVQNRQ